MRSNRAGDGEAPRAGGATNAPPAWLRNIAVWVGAGLAIVALVVLGVAVLPGWWAAQVGDWVQGVFGRGVPIGLGTGAVFTLLPLGVGLLAFRSGLTSKVRIALVVIALLLLLPNVLTIAIALGSGDARSELAIAAPGFRGATAIGIGLVILAFVVLLVVRRRSRHTRQNIDEAGERAHQLARERAEAARAQPTEAGTQQNETQAQPNETQAQPNETEAQPDEARVPEPAPRTAEPPSEPASEPRSPTSP